jgi:hypothetical protein
MAATDWPRCYLKFGYVVHHTDGPVVLDIQRAILFCDQSYVSRVEQIPTVCS